MRCWGMEWFWYVFPKWNPPFDSFSVIALKLTIRIQIFSTFKPYLTFSTITTFKIDLVGVFFKPCSNYFKKAPTIFQSQSIFHANGGTALNIFLLDDIQAKTKIRMFDVSGLQQIAMTFEARHYESFDKLGVLR